MDLHGAVLVFQWTKPRILKRKGRALILSYLEALGAKEQNK